MSNTNSEKERCFYIITLPKLFGHIQVKHVESILQSRYYYGNNKINMEKDMYIYTVLNKNKFTASQVAQALAGLRNFENTLYYQGMEQNHSIEGKKKIFTEITFPNMDFGRIYKGATIYLDSVTQYTSPESGIYYEIEWIEFQNKLMELSEITGLDYYLLLANISHESNFVPTAKTNEYKGLMQSPTEYLYKYAHEGGQYYNNFEEIRQWAEVNGADWNDIYNPITNISIGCMEILQHTSDKKDDLWLGLKAYKGGTSDISDINVKDIMFIRDELAKQAGEEVWFEDGNITKENFN